MLGAVVAVALVLVSGGSDADPRTPAALPGMPPPFLGTAVTGSGGLTAAVDAYGDVVDLRGPGPAGEALIDNPSARQTAGTVAPDTGIVPRVSIEGGPAQRYDRVVCTMPSPVAAKVAGLSSHEPLDYQGIVCASVLLNRPLSPYYVTNITDSWVPFTGVIDMSALVDPAEFGGNGLVYLPKYVAPDDPLFEQSDSEIEASFLGAIERMYPEFRRSDVRAFRVSRVRHVFPVPVLGYSKLVPPVKTGVPGLYCVNSSHIVNGTLNVNQTLELAARAAGELLSGQSSRQEVAA